MKQKRRLKLYLTVKKPMSQSFMNKCPATGGICLNPMCLFGCIEE